MAACAESAGATVAAAFALEVGSGFATYAGPDSPFTKVAGLGFADLTDDQLDEVEARYGELGVPVSVELSSLAEHTVGERLTARGYRLVSFENVLGRALGDVDPTVQPDGVDIAIADDVEAWVSLVAEASVHADAEGLEAHEEFSVDAIVTAERQLLAAGVRPYLARLDGVPAGGGSWRPAGRVAQMGGAATLVQHRRRGVQTALLARRLEDAAAAGHGVAVVTTQPGSRSQQNVQRAGFELLYVRAVLVKDTSVDTSSA